MDVRPARIEDHDEVAAFTRDTWGEGSDYIPDVFPEWVESGDDARTLVAEIDGSIAGLAQVVILEDGEGWCQGLRVNPDFRGRDVSRELTHDLFRWARDRGATVARNMVFSWNEAGLGQSRATGFRPVTEFRWAHPEPDADASLRLDRETDLDATDDPDVAWRAWADSPAADHLAGLALSLEESWALAEARRETFQRATEETAVFGVRGDDSACAAAYRVRDYERETDDGTEHRAEYGVGAWTDLAAADALFAAVRRDAAALNADRVRVLIPETARAVSDVARLRIGVSDEPDFVLAADLTGRRF